MPAFNDDEELRAALAELSEEELDELERSLAKIPPGEALGIKPARAVERIRITACFDFSKVSQAEQQIRALPKARTSVHCLMGGAYNGSDIIPAVQSLAGAPIDDLHIATLGFNKTNASQICTMFDDGLIKRMALICSHYFSSTDRSTFAFAADQFAARGQRIIATRTHAKVIVFRIGRSHYVVESSANLRSCNNLEQFSLTNSRTLADFHRRWIEHVLKQS